MTYTTLRRAFILPVLACVAMASGVYLQGYTTSGHNWGTNRVSYFVNPASKWVSPSAAVSALQQAASVWNTQAGANIELVYAGTTAGASSTLNRKNEIFFRNTTGGSVAETWWWYDGTGHLVDFDIIYYEGSYQFFAGSGCTSGVYIENVGVHELGHALGLGHSSVAGVSMQPKMTSYCDRSQLTLEDDDIAGIRALYPGALSAPPPVNTAPSAAILTPSNGSSASSGTVLTFSGSAGDSQDGNISHKLVWTSNLLGQIGVGASFTLAMTEGTHTITATVQDSGGLTASRQISVSSTAPAPAPAPAPTPTTPTLAANPYTQNGARNVSLSWTGLSTVVEVYRNGVKIKTLTDRVRWSDQNIAAAGSYTYKVCRLGVCSNSVTVSV